MDADFDVLQAHEPLEALLNALDVAVFVIDIVAPGRYVIAAVNSAYSEITGLRSHELRGQSLEALSARLFSAEHVSRFRARYDQAVRTGMSIDYDEQAELGGRIRTWRTRLAPVRSRTGEIRRLIGRTSEVTERSLIERSLADSDRRARQSSAWLHAFLEHAPLLAWVIGDDGRLLYVNEEYARVHGATVADFVGHSLDDVHAPELARLYAACHEDAKARRVCSEPFVRLGIRRDGTIGQYQLWCFAIPDGHDASGTSTTVTGGVAIDVTERDRAEAALRVSEARFRGLIETANEGVWIVDPDARTIYGNPELGRLLGVEPDSLLGHRVDDFLMPSTTSWVDAVLRAAEPAKRVAAQAFELRRPDGGTVWVRAGSAPLVDAEGRLTGVLAMLTNITAEREAEAERIRMDAQLRETQKLESLGILAGGIAHDFNNLLMGVLGNASIARDESPAGVVWDALNHIEESAARAADLCRLMLAYAGKGRTEVRALDLSQHVLETVELLRASISKRAALQLSLPPMLPPVLADSGQLRQVVLNLVVNASEALASQNGTISLSTRVVTVDQEALRHAYLAPALRTGTYVSLEVTDNGAGMDEATANRVFEPFFSTKGTGRGLGMAAVLGIVRSHEGAISVASVPGEGTTFCVWLPAFEGSVDATPSNAAVMHRSGEGRTILVVDDEPIVRKAACRMLRHIGYEVIEATDGVDGIAAYDRHRSDVHAVLLDLSMPLLDGESTLLALRERQPNLPIVLMSGYDEQDTIRRLGTEGATGFLQKPFGTKALRECMASALEARSVQG